MKTSLTKLRSKFQCHWFMALIILVSLTLTSAWARPVAMVVEVSGQVFTITPQGEAKSVKLNDLLDEKSEVMVEEGSTVTLNDYYDSTYHLIGGTHIKFFDRSVQLKKGKAWIQSKSSKHPLALTTANGEVAFTHSEFIAMFDPASSRSQFLVVRGEIDVANILDQNLKYSVSAGHFTLLDPEVENGLPRSPTLVGATSLNAALGEFKGLPTNLSSRPSPQRKIASFTTESNYPKKRGQIIYLKNSRLPASVAGSAHHYYQTHTKRKTSRRPTGLAPAPIRFYGVKTTQPESSQREPASIPVNVKLPKKETQTVSIDEDFGQSLKEETYQQRKYSKELESLIEDLKSF